MFASSAAVGASYLTGIVASHLGVAPTVRPRPGAGFDERPPACAGGELAELSVAPLDIRNGTAVHGAPAVRARTAPAAPRHRSADSPDHFSATARTTAGATDGHVSSAPYEVGAAPIGETWAIPSGPAAPSPSSFRGPTSEPLASLDSAPPSRGSDPSLAARTARRDGQLRLPASGRVDVDGTVQSEAGPQPSLGGPRLRGLDRRIDGTTVHVTIGRIELRAAAAANASAAVPPVAPRGVMSLDEYVERRRSGR